MPLSFRALLRTLFRADPHHYAGVPRINIYLLRLLYGLMFFMLGHQVWSHILANQDPWVPQDALAWSVWAAFATLAGVGLLHPVRMIPILLLEIFYKVLWLVLVAYPLWRDGALAGSPAEGLTYVFLGVVLAIVAVPWPHVLRTYFWGWERKEMARDWPRNVPKPERHTP